MNDSANPTISPENPGGSGIRQAVSNAAAYLLHNHTIPLLAVLFCAAAAIALWQLSRLSWQLVQSSALQGAAQQTNSLIALRKLYTSEVADRVAPHGSTHDYAKKEGAIPLPATFSMELSELISKVRETVEQEEQGTVPAALHVPYVTLAETLKPGGVLHQTGIAKKLIFICTFGERSAMAVQLAQALGFERARHLHGGLAEWRARTQS